MVPNNQFIDILKRLTIQGADGIVFRQKEVDAMLGGNASRIFKLNKQGE